VHVSASAACRAGLFGRQFSVFVFIQLREGLNRVLHLRSRNHTVCIGIQSGEESVHCLAATKSSTSLFPAPRPSTGHGSLTTIRLSLPAPTSASALASATWLCQDVSREDGKR
jgi:hypothetical protein